MKLKELKKLIDSLSESELEKPLLYNSKDYSISGEVKEVVRAKENLYWDGEDDPSRLLTKKEAKQEGFEIDELEVEIRKGDIVINL